MKEAVAGELAAAYDSGLIDTIRGNDFTYTSGRGKIHQARGFGLFLGGERAVD